MISSTGFLRLPAFLLLMFMIIGCGEPQPTEFKIYYTGNLIGSIDPCHCPGAPNGGLPRRATRLSQVRENPNTSILVDAGNFTSLSSTQTFEKTERILAGIKELGVRVVSLGFRDLRHSLADLKRLEEKHEIPFICGNLVALDDESSIFPSHVILETENDGKRTRIAVIGLVQGGPYREVPPEFGMKITPPSETLAKVMDEIGSKAEFYLLLSDAPIQTIAAWMEQADAYDIDLVLTSTNRVHHKRTMDIEGIPLYSMGRQGKYFDYITAVPTEGSWAISRETEDLDSTVDDDSGMVEFLAQLSEELNIQD